MSFSSAASPAALPPAPLVRIGDPGELLAALPFLMGFHPRDSLVVVAFGGASGRRVGLTQRVDLPPPQHAAAVCAALAGNVRQASPTGAGVLVVGGAAGGGPPGDGAAPPHADLVRGVTAALEGHGVPVRLRAWAAGTEAGAAWACYDECGCRGALPDPGATPMAATAVAAGVLVHADRAELERLVAPADPAVLRRRERLLTRAVDAGCGPDAGGTARRGRTPRGRTRRGRPSTGGRSRVTSGRPPRSSRRHSPTPRPGGCTSTTGGCWRWHWR